MMSSFYEQHAFHDSQTMITTCIHAVIKQTLDLQMMMMMMKLPLLPCAEKLLYALLNFQTVERFKNRGDV